MAAKKTHEQDFNQSVIINKAQVNDFKKTAGHETHKTKSKHIVNRKVTIPLQY